ncbi:MAG: transglycosylase SLT domain-containing protein [Bacteroidia bacterium]
MANLILEEKVTENRAAFTLRVKTISIALNIDPNWLMVVMNSESGLNHRAVNPNGGATGLIQFMPATAKGLGTSTAALRAMTNVQQLEYVYKYLKAVGRPIKSYTDLYLSIFFPAAMGKPDTYVFKTSNLSASVIAKANPVFDLNKDGQITVKEAEEAFLKRIPYQYAAYRDSFKKKVVPYTQG